MRSGRGIVGGVVLIALGVLVLLHNMGLPFFLNVWDWWPALLVVWGVSMLLSPARHHHRHDEGQWQSPGPESNVPPSGNTPPSPGWQAPPESRPRWQAPPSQNGGWQQSRVGSGWQAQPPSGSQPKWQAPPQTPPQPPRPSGSWSSPPPPPPAPRPAAPQAPAAPPAQQPVTPEAPATPPAPPSTPPRDEEPTP